CNGYAELCDRPYSAVVYPTTHNSYASYAGIAGNQNKDISIQLQDGIRALQLDFLPSSNDTNVVELCHTQCLFLDAGPATLALRNITTFLNNNPREVVTILIENAGRLGVQQMASAFEEVGLDKYAWTQSSSGSNSTSNGSSGALDWPTLQTMIDQNKRLVVFTDTGADANTVSWIHAEYTYAWETPWQTILGEQFSCVVDRPSTSAQPALGSLQVFNHFVYQNQQFLSAQYQISVPASANTTNSLESLQNHYDSCQAVYATLPGPTSGGSGNSTNSTVLPRVPNFVAVDYYNVGDLFRFVAEVNNVTY
ncbi:PLC-like phosphodiesterase, partial [Dimargaris cristalligena]